MSTYIYDNLIHLYDKGRKMQYNSVIDRLQNLTNKRITQQEIADIIGVGQNAISGRAKRNSEFSEDEIISLQNHYNVIIEDDSVTLDYYPDIFGSCGTGYFVSSEQKEQIQVPVNALFKSLSAGKKYSVINAQGNSMSPYIESGDKLIIEHLDNQPIIDNHVYVFCYDKDLYIKRLYKNIDEIIAKSDNTEPIFKVKSIPKEEWGNLQIIGEVVGLMRNLR